MKIKELIEVFPGTKSTPGKELYKKLIENPELANIHKEGQGQVGVCYRLGLAGSPIPKWLPQNGSEAHWAYKAGKENYLKKVIQHHATNIETLSK